MKFIRKKLLPLTLSALLAFSCCVFTSSAEAAASLSYSFSGHESDKAGYAEGKITFTANASGTYKLYWTDGEKALGGYYPITEMKLNSGESKSFTFGNHTAIPKNAAGIIAKDSGGAEVARYELSQNKRLNDGSGRLLYTFNSYSDLHIDKNGYYTESEKRWAQALDFGVKKNTDFIVSSGDMVSNKKGAKEEWKIYDRILADSGYVNPVWESNGNHDLKNDPAAGTKAYVRYSGTDSTAANYSANKPYYYMIEPKSGDVFIFMALETDSNPSSCEEFSKAQMDWVEELLDRYYGSGVNVYIIEHSPIKGFGAGDRMTKPYYKALLRTSNYATAWFKSILINHPNLIFMSGHTHEDLAMGYNYSNENYTACHMIHNPALTGTAWPNKDDTALDYNNGKGRSCQGYYVEVFENSVVFYGANITDKKIYPQYSYIMDGARESAPEPAETVPAVTTPEETEPGATGSTLPPNAETKRVYFANTLNWEYVACDTPSSEFPGYGTVFCGTDERGVDYYYCDILSTDTSVVWNNCGDGFKTVETAFDGTNDLFTPDTETNSDAVTVTTSIWGYYEPDEEETDPSSAEPTEPEQTEPTTVIDYQTGDVDADGIISIRDATEIQRALAKFITLTDLQERLADTDFNGSVTIKDATLIQKYLARYFASFEEAADGKDGETPVGAGSFSTELSNARDALSSYYTFASYDQYQELKNLYFAYKNTAPSNESEAAAALSEKLAKLRAIVNHVNGTAVYNIGDEYFFENNLGWSTVYGYAWTGSDHNAEWPGVRLSKVGTQSGHDVYSIKFSSPGQYSSLIFSNGSDQTADIALEKQPGNCFRLSGKDSNGKYNVTNLSYTPQGSTEPTTQVSTEPATQESSVPATQGVTEATEASAGEEYFFENSSSWSTVYGYAWTGSDHNAEWPGVKLSKVGTQSGHDVYSIKFSSPGQYSSLIFSNGSSQTVNIELQNYSGNCFCLNGTDSSGKYKVKNCTYDPEASSEPATAGATLSKYALYYYTASHKWGYEDGSRFTDNGDGTYSFRYVSPGSDNLSLCVYSTSSGSYKCVSSSESFNFESGKATDFTLTSSDSRGSSITVKGLSAGAVMNFLYTSSDKKLKITCE